MDPRSSMFRHLALTAAVAVMPFLGACATWNNGTTQSVEVQTTPHSSARCNLANAQGSWTIDSTPGSAIVKRSGSDLAIKCATDGGHSGSSTYSSKVVGAGTFLRVGLPGIGALALALIELGIDASLGGAYHYPPVMVVLLQEPSPGVDVPSSSQSPPMPPPPPGAEPDPIPIARLHVPVPDHGRPKQATAVGTRHMDPQDAVRRRRG